MPKTNAKFKKRSHTNHENIQQEQHKDRNKREDRTMIKVKGREIHRCRFAGERRISHRRWHPPEKHDGMRCRVKPVVFYTSACALINFSLCNTSRITLVVASLVCMYGATLFRMLVSFEQHNDVVRSICNHSNLGHECLMNDVRREKIKQNKKNKSHQKI